MSLCELSAVREICLPFSTICTLLWAYFLSYRGLFNWFLYIIFRHHIKNSQKLSYKNRNWTDIFNAFNILFLFQFGSIQCWIFVDQIFDYNVNNNKQHKRINKYLALSRNVSIVYFVARCVKKRNCNWKTRSNNNNKINFRIEIGKMHSQFGLCGPLFKWFKASVL